MNKANKIVSNTIILYGKMGITIVLSLLSTRWVLSALGQTDFGIYNLVAGLVAMFAFLNSAMSVASQRFISYALGTENVNLIKQTFYYSVVQHLIVAVLISILFELFGCLFMNTVLNIPEDRINDAFFVLHCLTVSTCFTVISVPYQAVANSHENMLIIALISILESLLKFLIALFLLDYAGNKLRLYAFSFIIISVISYTIIRCICRRKYFEVKYTFQKINDWNLFNRFSTYAIWNFFGAIGGMVKNQGVAMIMNVFFGVAINAAYGIANQVNGQLQFLSNTIVRAIQPQLIQSEGAGDRKRMLSLSVLACKLPSLLLMIMLYPLIIRIDFILDLWLGDVPDFAGLFCKLILCYTLIYQLYHGLELSLHACGQIKWYQITAYGLQLLILPIGYCLYELDAPVDSILWVSIVVCVINLFVTLLFSSIIAKLNWRDYCRTFLIRTMGAMFLVYIILNYIENFVSNNLLGLFILYLINLLLSFIVFWFVIANANEKMYSIQLVSKVLSSIREKITRKG